MPRGGCCDQNRAGIVPREQEHADDPFMGLHKHGLDLFSERNVIKLMSQGGCSRPESSWNRSCRSRTKHEYFVGYSRNP
eukprot:gene1762-biopygen1232